MIIYGGSEGQVRLQLLCGHDWHGPCIDNISRYNKCKKCFCVDRDVQSMDEYYKLVDENTGENGPDVFSAIPPIGLRTFFRQLIGFIKSKNCKY